MKNIFTLLFVILSISAISQSGFPEFGKASFYADKFEGKLTASGEKYKHNDMTAAHKSLPFGTKIKVTNLTNGKTVTVRVNDRGPYIKDRVIDLSKKAAEKLDFIEIGIVDVKVELVDIVEEKALNKYNDVADNQPEAYSEFSYYEVNAKKIEPLNYGIQIGSYTDSGNLLKTISDFKQNFSYDIIVQESVENGNRKYRLVVGNFSKRIDAESKLAELRKAYTDCFILNLE